MLRVNFGGLRAIFGRHRIILRRIQVVFGMHRQASGYLWYLRMSIVDIAPREVMRYHYTAVKRCYITSRVSIGQFHKQKDRDEAEGNNFHFLLFCSPQPHLIPFVCDHQSVTRNSVGTLFYYRPYHTDINPKYVIK